MLSFHLQPETQLCIVFLHILNVPFTAQLLVLRMQKEIEQFVCETLIVFLFRHVRLQ